MESEIRVIKDPKLVKVLVSETRGKLMDEIHKEPKSISQLARIFGKTPVAIHYHIKKLEEAGFIKLAKTRVVNNNLIEKYYQPSAPPFVICLSTEASLIKAPVPPKKHITKQEFTISIPEIEGTLSSLGLTYQPEKEDQLKGTVMKLLKMIVKEAKGVHKEILKQINLKLSSTDLLKVESITEALVPITLLRMIRKPQYLEALRSLIQELRTK